MTPRPAYFATPTTPPLWQRLLPVLWPAATAALLWVAPRLWPTD